MNEIVTFNLENQEYPMDIIDRNGDRWIPSKQVGEAGFVNQKYQRYRC